MFCELRLVSLLLAVVLALPAAANSCYVDCTTSGGQACISPCIDKSWGSPDFDSRYTACMERCKKGVEARCHRQCIPPEPPPYGWDEQVGDRCRLAPGADYAMVVIWTAYGGSSTSVVGPDWVRNSAGSLIALQIADRASLEDGKAWWMLPDETPAYCEVTIKVEIVSPGDEFDGDTQELQFYIFGLPKDLWTHDRNHGIAGYLRTVDQFFEPGFHRLNVSVGVNEAAHSWLTDYHARLEREIEALEEQLAEEFGEDAPVSDEVAGDQDHYLSVATSPPPGSRLDPGKPGYFGIGWHTESQHDAGTTAVAECEKQGGGNCSFNAAGTSVRGGCVGLAMASWRDRDQDAERTYVVASSSFRELIARDLRSGCRSTALAGKYEDTVLEHSCEIVRVTCAGDFLSARP